jgi:hypothetical protein
MQNLKVLRAGVDRVQVHEKRSWNPATHLVAFMIRAHLDLYPSHVCVKMDMETHFGEVSRAAAMRVHCSVRGDPGAAGPNPPDICSALPPFLWKALVMIRITHWQNGRRPDHAPRVHAEGSPLFYVDGTRAKDILEGAKQGSPGRRRPTSVRSHFNTTRRCRNTRRSWGVPVRAASW